MLRWLTRLAAIGVAAVALSGCFSSDYDISRQLKPDFPLAVGKYNTPKGDKPVTVSRRGDSYRALERSGERTKVWYVRLFRVPEVDKHIVQVWSEPKDGAKAFYVYLYADVGPDRLTFLDCVFEDLPQYLQNLVEKKQDFDLAIRDGSRDTLYVVRETARRGITLKAGDTYVHQ